MINAMTVTQSELMINDQKPNLPSMGDHSDEKITSLRPRPSSSGVDFITNPTPIANGISKQNVVHSSIHLDEMASVIFLFISMFMCQFG